MNSGFLNNLWPGPGNDTWDQVPAEQTDQQQANPPYIPRGREAVSAGSINWDAIIEESGSSQFALHLFLTGFGKGETIALYETTPISLADL